MTEGQGRVTLWGIEVFLAVTEEGAISAAARRLGVSPSAISQQLTGLETALGAVLLDRSARPMGLTPAGTMFRRHAQTILNAEAEARSELAMADLSGLTTLRLGVCVISSGSRRSRRGRGSIPTMTILGTTPQSVKWTRRAMMWACQTRTMRQ